MLFGPVEPQAHVAIISEVNAAIAECRDANVYRLWKPLESFAPRCNCGRVLKFGPVRSGARMVMCGCGVTYWEAKL